MNFWLGTLLVVAAVLLMCPMEISGKKYQKDEHEKKVFTRTSSSSTASDSKTVQHHHVKHNPKEREVLIRSTRGAKASDNSPAGVGDVIADNAAPGKERKNKKNHKKTLNQSQQLPLSLPHDSSDLPSSSSNNNNNNNNKHSRNNNPGQSERHQSKFNNKRKQQISENTHDTKEHSKNSEGGNNAPSCHYVKGNWSECDATTNIRSRTLTLKDGDNKECVPTRTIQKKCKKAMMNHGCRYEKGNWSECLNGEQTRLDTLKTGMASPPASTCEQTRSIKKSCKTKKSKTNKERKNNKLTGRKGRGGAQH